MFGFGPAERIRKRQLIGDIVVRGCRVQQRALEVCLAGTQSDKCWKPSEVGKERLGSGTCLRVGQTIEAVTAGAPVSRTEFVHDVRSQRGCEIQREKLRSAKPLAAEARWQCLKVRSTVGIFVGVGATQLVRLVEIVIDPDVRLFPTKHVRTGETVIIELKYAFAAVTLVAGPSISGSVQA